MVTAERTAVSVRLAEQEVTRPAERGQEVVLEPDKMEVTKGLIFATRWQCFY